MRSIQEVGTEILTSNPKSFYIFAGTEYGIKRKYIQQLVSYYSGKYKEAASVDEVLQFMSVKHIFPPAKMLYIVRYDESFISSLSATTESTILSTNILGTVVCIYEQDKDKAKLEKYVPNLTVEINPVAKEYINKYLHTDYPTLKDEDISAMCEVCSTYAEAYNMAASLSHAVGTYSIAEIKKSISPISMIDVESQLQFGIAARNFSYLEKLLTKMDSFDSVHYAILHTLLELEKIFSSSYSSSPIVKYKNLWTLQEVYNLFMITYQELNTLRTISSDAYSSAIKLFSILTFRPIPSKEAMYGV